MAYHKDKNRLGTTLNNPKEHIQDHKKWSRRSFLRDFGLLSGSGIVLGGLPIHTLLGSPLSYALNCSGSDRILVLVKLNGGNDGLNTIIPSYNYGRYQQLRPGIHIPQSQTIQLNAELSLNRRLESIMPMWQEGAMKVIENIGYPDQNLSHFRSSDIWNSASDSDTLETSGWLGRFFEDKYPDFINSAPDCPPAVAIGGGSLITTNTDGLNMAVNFQSPDQLRSIAERGSLFDVVDVPDCLYGEQLAYTRSIANTIYRYAETLGEAYDSSSNTVSYPTELGDQLALVARLIKGDLGTQFYTASLGSFDTHASQVNTHNTLLQNLSDSVSAFFNDLKASGHDKKVLLLTYSEFGRRPEQNASQGTDHGAAAPSLIFGSGLNGNGVLGGLPDLDDLDRNENLKYRVDFRSLYASLLEHWICIDPQLVNQILGANHDRMHDLGLNCQPVSSAENQNRPKFAYQAYINAIGQVEIKVRIPSNGRLEVIIQDLLGRSMASIYNGSITRGERLFSYQIPNNYPRPSYLALSLIYNGEKYSKSLLFK